MYRVWNDQIRRNRRSNVGWNSLCPVTCVSADRTTHTLSPDLRCGKTRNIDCAYPSDLRFLHSVQSCLVPVKQTKEILLLILGWCTVILTCYSASTWMLVGSKSCCECHEISEIRHPSEVPSIPTFFLSLLQTLVLSHSWIHLGSTIWNHSRLWWSYFWSYSFFWFWH